MEQMMSLTGKALFVHHPRRIDNLRCTDGYEVKEIEYQIREIVNLKEIDFENFITDMTVSRYFLDSRMAKEIIEGRQSCQLIVGQGLEEKILVLAENKDFVGYAAIYTM